MNVKALRVGADLIQDRSNGVEVGPDLHPAVIEDDEDLNVGILSELALDCRNQILGARAGSDVEGADDDAALRGGDLAEEGLVEICGRVEGAEFGDGRIEGEEWKRNHHRRWR